MTNNIYHSVGAYINASEIWNNTPSRFSCGKHYRMIDGKWVQDDLGSKPVYQPPLKENPDSRVIPGFTVPYKN